MSNFIHCNVVGNKTMINFLKQMRSSIEENCMEYDLYIKTNKTLCAIENGWIFSFVISDDPETSYCEFFLEPLVYCKDGLPNFSAFFEDIFKLKKIIYNIFSFKFVQSIELKFSFVEVDESDYEVLETDLITLEEDFLAKFLMHSQMPVMKVIIKNKDYKN